MPWREVSKMDERREFVRLAMQPGANRQPNFQNFVFPDINMSGFLNREGKAGRAMIENGR